MGGGREKMPSDLYYKMFSHWFEGHLFFEWRQTEETVTSLGKFLRPY